MIIVGLCLIPIVLHIIKQLNDFRIKNLKKILLHTSLIAITLIYFMAIFLLDTEPFDFEIIETGDYLIYSAGVFIFSPFLWIILYYYCKNIFRHTKIQKNAKLKTDDAYIYCRDDLNKISPTIIMFTSMFDIDLKKSISATILKLKLTGYLQEIDNSLQYTNKEVNDLLESEKMILNYITNNTFDSNLYKRTIRSETLKNKYVKINNSGKTLKILKMLGTILIPIILLNGSFILDEYSFSKYRTYEFNNVKYVYIKNYKEAIALYFDGEIDEKDYYHVYDESTNEWDHNYSSIRADKLEYKVVREKFILDIIVPLSILVSVISIFVSLFMLIDQIKYFNKSYMRTSKGNELLNKAYALKNYLHDFSMINQRTEKELVLWEYYLIYAIILDVNVTLDDELIQKYIANI